MSTSGTNRAFVITRTSTSIGLARGQFMRSAKVGGSCWRREKVYYAFIFGMRHDECGSKNVVLEMKRSHLVGKDDTDYKMAVLKLMTRAFSNTALILVFDVFPRVIQRI